MQGGAILAWVGRDMGHGITARAPGGNHGDGGGRRVPGLAMAIAPVQAPPVNLDGVLAAMDLDMLVHLVHDGVRHVDMPGGWNGRYLCWTEAAMVAGHARAM